MIDLNEKENLVINLNRNVLMDILTNEQESIYKELDYFDFMVYIILRTRETYCCDYQRILHSLQKLGYLAGNIMSIQIRQIRHGGVSIRELYNIIFPDKPKDRGYRIDQEKKIKQSICKLLNCKLLFCCMTNEENSDYQILSTSDYKERCKDKNFENNLLLFNVTYSNYTRIPAICVEEMAKYLRRQKNIRDKGYYFVLLCCIYNRLGLNDNGTECFIPPSEIRYFTPTRSGLRKTKWERVDDVLKSVGIVHITKKLVLEDNFYLTTQYFGTDGIEKLELFIKKNKQIVIKKISSIL